jgi:hypothetical protein
VNASGGVIWRALKEGRTPEAMTGELQRHYEVSAERASRSVTALLDALMEHGLVRSADEP